MWAESCTNILKQQDGSTDLGRQSQDRTQAPYHLPSGLGARYGKAQRPGKSPRGSSGERPNVAGGSMAAEAEAGWLPEVACKRSTRLVMDPTGDFAAAEDSLLVPRAEAWQEVDSWQEVEAPNPLGKDVDNMDALNELAVSICRL
ncbi:hypothetical protein AK812_SmicGene25976 [Symbiodinium microadriaticum]|uniref:Uncharacterized protein n=1 Tax=Symbiodinium microadriaticum TaxID=2951 RepID=A0A1Q9DAS0_SYMMI|nr:hypothetical protein AK812_SmicGene25976 [Symbiodinium microadriaticum]